MPTHRFPEDDDVSEPADQARLLAVLSTAITWAEEKKQLVVKLDVDDAKAIEAVLQGESPA